MAFSCFFTRFGHIGMGILMGFSGFHDLELGHFCLNWLIMFLDSTEIPSSLLWAFAYGYSIGMVHLLFLV
jgi:hypothetical protein